MEGLIPYVIQVMRRQRLHKHSYRCLSNGSRQSYHLLSSPGTAFDDGSSRRGIRSEFTPPASMDWQPKVNEFVRSRSIQGISYNNNNEPITNNYGSRQTPQRNAAYDYKDIIMPSSKGINK